MKLRFTTITDCEGWISDGKWPEAGRDSAPLGAVWDQTTYEDGAYVIDETTATRVAMAALGYDEIDIAHAMEGLN